TVLQYYLIPYMTLFRSYLLISVNDIISSRTVADHRKRITHFFFDELDIIPAVLREILVFPDAADITLPARKRLKYRFCLFNEVCHREICGDLSVDLISHAHRDLIQIPQNVKYSKRNIRCPLHPASVFGSHAVKPAHTPRASGRRTVLSAVTASSSQLFRLVTKDLADK